MSTCLFIAVFATANESFVDAIKGEQGGGGGGVGRHSHMDHHSYNVIYRQLYVKPLSGG